MDPVLSSFDQPASRRARTGRRRVAELRNWENWVNWCCLQGDGGEGPMGSEDEKEGRRERSRGQDAE